ncbi:hypothetical protein [Photorhabdus cinerea]|uniref:Uncharacterized protein n=1 Tax=Photorhabdus cinerea TaxID=471575 RepID=A0A7X5TK36_9GAMM|nr:hypothetical protein [Photorhabdus cinerea]NHB94562.1 hypothetical protein [Photorhabdus cinerea]
MSDPLREVIESTRDLNHAVETKINDIDNKVDNSIRNLENWKSSASYIQEYYSGFPEAFLVQNTENWHVVQLYRIKNKLTTLNPWVHIALHGGNNVGSLSFLSLSQAHAGYTGQVGMILKRGNPRVKFFIDRANENDAPVLIAVQNSSHNSASVEVKAASYMALDFKFVDTIKEKNFPSSWEEIKNIFIEDGV